MSYKIVWLPQAEHTFILVLDYLEQEWTSKEVARFIDRVEEVIGFLSKNPRQYLYSKKKDMFRAVVTKQVSLYYRMMEKG